jgi:hypothetical protein
MRKDDEVSAKPVVFRTHSRRVAITALMALVCARPSSASSTAELVRALSWQSVRGECHFVWQIHPTGKEAKRLIRAGKSATDDLFNALGACPSNGPDKDLFGKTGA